MLKISIELECPTQSQLDALATLIGGKSAIPVEVTPTVDDTAKATPKTKKARAKPEPEPETEPTAEDFAPDTAVTMIDIRELAVALTKTGKQPEIKEVFSQYGIEKLSDLDEKDYPAMLADLRAL